MSIILAIDQGTTSSRAIVFDRLGNIVAQDQQEFTQYFPQNGWVEHDANEIWQTTLKVCQTAIQKSGVTPTCIGITNQRETTVLWNKKTGQPVYHAIVWQDRRTADRCIELKQHEKVIHEKTGLLLDPYFSATKLEWLLSRNKADGLAFGTIDSFLLWHLTAGKSHYTDATNASRTLLYNIHTGEWDQELLNLFSIPKELLPQVKNSSDNFGVTDKQWFGSEIPITGIAGDQHAALFGQACFEPGMVKSTYGTGCFMLVNSGNRPVLSKHRLLTTPAYQINNLCTYALEGSIFIAGAAVQWLRDQLQIIKSSQESEALMKSVANTGGVYFVPALTGLGAPYWQPHARGTIVGLTRDSNRAHVVRAALEAVCYQTRDLLEAMQQDGVSFSTLRVDGGMAKNNTLMQFLADILGVRVERPVVTETTALGVAYLAGLQAGLYASLEEIAELWKREACFGPKMSRREANDFYQGWQEVIGKTILSNMHSEGSKD